MALLSRPDVGHHARKPERHVDVGIVVVLRRVSDALKRRTIRDLKQERVCRCIRHFLNCTHKSTLSLAGNPLCPEINPEIPTNAGIACYCILYTIICQCFEVFTHEG